MSQNQPSEDIQQKNFTQTYYLFLILFGLHFVFSMFMYYRIEQLSAGNLKAGGNTQPTVQGADTAPPTIPPPQIDVEEPTQDEPWKGPENARYVMIEYSDFECPFCQKIHPDLVRIYEEYDNLAWVFRHLPLSFHPKAPKLGEGAECAGAQDPNAFWEFSDIVFERMPDIELDELGEIAAEIDLNQSEFQSCLDSDRFKAAVEEDLASASQSGVQATPTVIFYDLETGETAAVEGALPYENIKQILDGLIEETS